MQLRQPSGSHVSVASLSREVNEYFDLGATVARGDTVLDVGANVGAFSLRVAELCDGDVTLLCFEPSPETYRALRANFDRNELLRNTRHSVFPVGLTSESKAGRGIVFFNFRRFPTNSTFDLASKRREFEIFFEVFAQRVGDKVGALLPGTGRALNALISYLPKGKLGWWASRHIMGLEEITAELDTVDAVVRRAGVLRIDLLKIDVEGPELDVLLGIGPAVWPMVHQVVMETHDRDGRQAVIEAVLRTNGLADIRTMPQKSVDNGLDSVMLLARRTG
jgi:FkbM family methyltransferase